MKVQGRTNADYAKEAIAFVRAWQAANSLDEVCTALTMNPVTCRQRAYYYRRKGIPLKRFGNSSRSLDYDGLAKLAASLGGEDATDHKSTSRGDLEAGGFDDED